MGGRHTQRTSKSVGSAKIKKTSIPSGTNVAFLFYENAKKRRDNEKKLLLRQLKILDEECKAIVKEHVEDTKRYKNVVLKTVLFQNGWKKRKRHGESGARKRLKVEKTKTCLKKKDIGSSILLSTVSKHAQNGHGFESSKAPSNRKDNDGGAGNGGNVVFKVPIGYPSMRRK